MGLCLHLMGKPLFLNHYTRKLNDALHFIGLSTDHYKPHSFRIGAATTAFQCKIPEENIRLMGRWNSDAIQRYFRIPVFEGVEVGSIEPAGTI